MSYLKNYFPFQKYDLQNNVSDVKEFDLNVADYHPVGK